MNASVHSTAPFFASGDRFPSAEAPSLSVVAPMFNEAGGAQALAEEIASVLGDALQDGESYEIIAVDDASTDQTREALRAAKASVPALRIIAHGENAGQSRALRTGVLAARAPVIATLDGDGQNDPADIPALWRALTAPEAAPNLAMIAGERRKRQDTAAKRWASRIANNARSAALKDGAADTGCGLKVFYRDAFLRLPYFDHCHRYLPALMRREGYEIAFSPVNHRPRTHGASKYTNIGRLAVAFRDMLGVMWLNDRARGPKEISEL